MLVEDFDIVTILGNTINAPMYKVKNKETHQLFIWHTIDLEGKNEAEMIILEEKIKKRIELNHTHLLKVHNLVKQESSKVSYIMTEYCENLKSIIRKCIKSKTHLSEEFICRILYQIAVFVKATEFFVELADLDNIFLDDEFNIKMYNFSLESHPNYPKLSSIGLIAYELCTLQKFNRNCDEIQKVSVIYSTSLITLIKHMIEDDGEITKNINKVLCYPIVLLKSSQWSKDNCFLNSAIDLKQENAIERNVLTVGIGKLRSKELALRVQKQKLDEWEQSLKKKGKELYILEGTIKEKLQKAELYLKRCRNTKTASSDSNLADPSTKLPENKSCDNLNSTYVSIDTTILPTSKKLNVTEIVKPAPFTRTLSERRIRFKGHSPLKDIDYNRKRNTKPSKTRDSKKPGSWLTCSEETDRSSVDDIKKRSKAKLLFMKHDQYEYENENANVGIKEIEVPCQTTMWTEENKRHAFQLLRLMKDNNKKKNIRHTYL